MTKIKINNVAYYGFNGISDAEKTLGGRYQVDFEYWYDAENACANDSIAQAINYNDVLFTISDIVENESFDLIEALANNILVNVIEKFEQIEKATIRVRKLNVPVNHYLDYVEVEQTLERSNIS